MGILGIVGVVAVLVINPTELFARAKDSNRISDVLNINKAINIYETLGGSVSGAPNIVYVSIPDDFSNCSGLDLPALPTDWSYHCENISNYRRMNGTGWIPIDFSSISSGSPFSVLPVDPVNSVEKKLYYVYVNGEVVGSWALAATLESEKYLSESANTDQGVDASKFEVGTDPWLLAVLNGLVGRWSLDSADIDFGSGLAHDVSGYDNHANIYNLNPSSLVSGAVGQGLQYNGTDSYAEIPIGAGLDSAFGADQPRSWSYWINWQGGENKLLTEKGGWDSGYEMWSESHSLYSNYIRAGVNYDNGIIVGNLVVGNWYFIAFTYDGIYTRAYVNGTLIGNPTAQTVRTNSGPVYFGGWTNANYTTPGILDDLRIYNRALSKEEVLSLYQGNFP